MGDQVSEIEKRQKRCCFTGHRLNKLNASEEDIKIALADAIDSALATGKRTFISGLCWGVDIWAAELVLQRRKGDSSIHLIGAIPHPGFEKRWSAHWQQRYQSILREADLVRTITPSFSMGSYLERNKWMVDRSGLVIAVFNGERGGTKNTIDYAMAQGVPVLMIDMQRGSKS